MLVGKDISSYAYPKSVKIKREDSKGVLILAIKRGDEINIEYSKQEIINKINSYFGYKLLSEIRLQVINSESKKIKNKNALGKFSKSFEKKINEIKNKDIRNSLYQLLKTIKND